MPKMINVFAENTMNNNKDNKPTTVITANSFNIINITLSPPLLTLCRTWGKSSFDFLLAISHFLTSKVNHTDYAICLIPNCLATTRIVFLLEVSFFQLLYIFSNSFRKASIRLALESLNNSKSSKSSSIMRAGCELIDQCHIPCV